MTSCDSGGIVIEGATGAGQATPTPTPPAERVLEASDYVLAEGPIMTGFTAKPADGRSNSEDVAMADVATCLGVPADRLQGTDLDEASGPSFGSDLDPVVSVSSTASIVSAEQAAADLEILKHPRFAECFGEGLQKEFNNDGDADTDVQIVAVETPEAPAGAAALLRISMGVTASGETIGIVIDNMFFVKDRVEATVSYTNVDNNPAPAHLQRIADHISGKLEVQ